MKIIIIFDLTIVNIIVSQNRDTDDTNTTRALRSKETELSHLGASVLVSRLWE